MEYYGGDNEGGGNDLLEESIQSNNAEIEQKRQSITKERLDIIKSQGAPNWTPEPLAAVTGTPNKPRRSNTLAGKSQDLADQASKIRL